MLTEEDGEEVDEEEINTRNTSTSSSAKIEGGVSYDLYSAFWKLQSFFLSESKAVDKALWKDFVACAKQTVKLFETNKQPHEQHAHSDSTSDPQNTSADNDSDVYMGCKFLTSSQLFSLQLRDPVLRQQISVQLLYFVHYL
eukprot:gene1087-1443_t